VTVLERAPAKINLGLRITGKRPDGYHDILSLFQTVTLHDVLEIDDTGEPGIVCSGGDVPENADNLIMKAEKVFRDVTGLCRPVRFTLTKRIPVGAGLGGGSSDAAAALRGLARLNGINPLNNRMLLSCAEKIGSDVPFLLMGGTAIVEGRGERLTAVKWPFDWAYVIVFPGFGVSTAWAYGQVRSYSPVDDEYGGMLKKLALGTTRSGELLTAIGNDFEDAVFPEYPLLVTIRDNLVKSGADAAFLTGSGSSMVGVFGAHDAAEKSAETFRNCGLDAWAVITER